ncbi:hypothetical protein GC173_05125 [bacterium]|nr:hypothetical protein [bacterium]
MTRPGQEEMSEADVRKMLAAVYGETPDKELEEASGLEATRETLTEYMEAPLAEGLRARFRETVRAELAQAAPAAIAKFTAMRGSAWYQRPTDKTAFAAKGLLPVVPGMRVGCARGGSAILTFLDGTTLALGGDSELELGAAGTAAAASLKSGRFYAWVTRQPKGQHFRLGTPEGEIAVLGTEFEVRLDTGNETRVTVTEGCVSFHGASVEPEGAIRLERGAEVRARNGRARVRALSRTELMLCGAWARQGRRGQGSLAIIAAIVLLVAVAFGLYKAFGTDSPASDSPSTQVAADVRPSGSAPQSASSTSSIPGWDAMPVTNRASIEVSTMTATGWRPASRMRYESRVEPGSGDVLTRIFDLVGFGADGRERPIPSALTPPIIRTKGSNISIEGGPDTLGLHAVTAINRVLYNPTTYVPEPWSTGRRTGVLNGALSQMPNAAYQISYAVDPTGPGTSEGRATDGYKIMLEGHFGEVELPPVQNGSVLMLRSLKRRTFRIQADLQLLAGTTTPAEFIIHEQRIDDVHQRLQPKNGKAVESDLPRSREELQITIKYDPPLSTSTPSSTNGATQ